MKPWSHWSSLLFKFILPCLEGKLVMGTHHQQSQASHSLPVSPSDPLVSQEDSSALCRTPDWVTQSVAQPLTPRHISAHVFSFFSSKSPSGAAISNLIDLLL